MKRLLTLTFRVNEQDMFYSPDSWSLCLVHLDVEKQPPYA